MGIDKLSLSPYSIPRIKELIRSVDYSHCRELTRRIDSCTTAEEIRRILEPELKNILPSFLLS
jgi:phosphotransferase system enzyme I (PtsI)